MIDQEINKQIADTLAGHLQAYTEGDNEKASRMDKLIEENLIDWLTHQSSIISQQSAEINELNKRLDMMTSNANLAFQTFAEKESRLSAEIERHKTIAELAVKALEEIQNSRLGKFEITSGEGHVNCINTASTALSDINSLPEGRETP